MPNPLPVLWPGTPMAQARLASELQRVLEEFRQRAGVRPSTLPEIQSAVGEVIDAAVPAATTPAEQTARPSIIRRAIRYAANRLADALEGAGRRRAAPGSGRQLARELARRFRGR